MSEEVPEEKELGPEELPEVPEEEVRINKRSMLCQLNSITNKFYYGRVYEDMYLVDYVKLVGHIEYWNC